MEQHSMPPRTVEQAWWLNLSGSRATMADVIRTLPYSILLTAICSAAVHSAPEDRGRRGAYIALGNGFALGHATDGSGESAGSHYGSDFNFRFGEEVLNRFTLGMSIAFSTVEGNQGLYTANSGGLLFDATWQILADTPFSMLLGTGFGGGSLSAKGDNGFSGDVAGAFFIGGAQYDFRWTRKNGGGFSLSPYFRGHYLPMSGDSGTRILTWMLGVETAWAWGRDKSE